MPSFVKLPSGNIRIIGKIQGKQYSKTFRTKKECREWWALQLERSQEKRGLLIEGKTLLDALSRYSKEVTTTKKGQKQELNRIKFLIRSSADLVSKPLQDITVQDAVRWKNERYANGKIKSSTLIKDTSLLSNVFLYCIQEWFWCKENPFKGLKMPKKPAPRDRILSNDEIEKMRVTLGFSFDTLPLTLSSRVGAIMLFAIETGMRSAEICNMEWKNLKNDGTIIHVPDSKTQSGIRDVPLSTTAQKIINSMKLVNKDNRTIFNVSKQARDALFRKARKKARLSGFTFHDTRATALTKLSKILNPYELTKMVGHSDFNEIMTYYRESAESIGKKLL